MEVKAKLEKAISEHVKVEDLMKKDLTSKDQQIKSLHEKVLQTKSDYDHSLQLNTKKHQADLNLHTSNFKTQLFAL